MEGCVDGTSYARLKPGGDLQHLEAMGKVLGLALRDQQPLGVDICPPLAHLLTHPTLPKALQQILRDNTKEENLGIPVPLETPMDLNPGATGVDELRRLGFSAEWLRYEEYDFWRQAANTSEAAASTAAVPLDAVDYHGPRNAEGLREHMEQKALTALVLDVSTELEHLWRGLRSVPNLSLPSLEREVKRGLENAEVEVEVERPTKRRRLERSILQDLISGGPDVPVTLWQAATRYSPIEATHAVEGQRTVTWFWDYVASLTVEQRSQLLQWITGYRRIPPGGFPSPVPYMTLHLANVSPDRLPTAHTCGLQLDLPRSYSNAEQLRQRLSQARKMDTGEPQMESTEVFANLSTSKRHFCRKTNCDGSCFTLNLLNFPKETAPPEPAGSTVEPPLKRRKLEDDETVQGRPQTTMARSVGHMVLDVTRMAAFSTAGYVFSGPVGATVAFSVASAKSLRTP
eukprot:symbB.v1.2.001108.t1/scaffold59.1/size365495/12